MARQQIRCHGDESRFDILAQFIYDYYGNSVKYIADVAGGQGLLTRVLNKKYNYQAEVIDPRGFRLKGVPGRECLYTSDMAGYYDLIVGLHPDEAIRPVIESAKERPVLAIPCCNHWDASQKLGSVALIQAIEQYLKENSVTYEVNCLAFKGPKNVAIVTRR